MRPLIGITADFVPGEMAGRAWHDSRLLVSYAEAIQAVGGLPVVLSIADDATAAATVERLDGLILSGGRCDVPPSTYGESKHAETNPLPDARWENECRWLRAARAASKPVLGICLGMQVIGVTHGATMIQHIPDEPGLSQHTDATRMFQHDIRLQAGSWLRDIAPAEQMPISSAHHQALRTVPGGFTLTASAGDGVIEGIESQSGPFLVGVQWHPERSLKQPDWVLKGFVEICARI